MNIPYEFYILTGNLPQSDQGFSLQPYQFLTKSIINPYSTKYRFLIKHGTGLGKTVQILNIAKNFIKKNKRVFIFTFNESLFINEIIKFPQLGIISDQTVYNLMNASNDETYKQARKKAKKEIKKQITFYGYKEFQNILFHKNNTGFSINYMILYQFYESLIVCDEIHDVYNEEQQNTWGKSIQVVADLMGSKVHILYLSATPLNNPGEIVNLLSLMSIQQQPKDWESIKNKASQWNYQSLQDIQLPQKFQNLQASQNEQEIKSQIKHIMLNNVSFVPESQQFMPRQDFQGLYYNSIKNIMIYKCLQSDLFFDYMKRAQDYLHDEEWRKYVCFDFPEHKIDHFIINYKKRNPQTLEWASINGVQVVQKDGRDLIVGSFLNRKNIQKYSPKFYSLINLILTIEGKSFIYINKVKNVGTDMIASLLKENGIIHIDDVPSQNTLCFICKNQMKDHKTMQHEQSSQTKTGDHQFIPYRFILMTSKNSKEENDRQIALYNDPRNTEGKLIQIIIGSKMIKQGFNILSTNNTFILNLPFNIPNLIQLLGRTSRTKSHFLMSPEKQYVNIYVMVTASENGHLHTSDHYQELLESQQQSSLYRQVTREELEYYTKMQKYQQIQQYEKIIHQVSIDPEIYGDRYFIQETTQEGIKFKLQNELKMIPFTPQHQYNYDKYDMTNYYQQQIYQDVFSSLDIIIQQKFKQNNVWKIDDLIQSIKNTESVPSTDKIKETDIYHCILNQTNIKSIGPYIMKSDSSTDIDWFLFQKKQSEMKEIIISKIKEKHLNIGHIVEKLSGLNDYNASIESKQISQGQSIISIQFSNDLIKIIKETFKRFTREQINRHMFLAFENNNFDLMKALFLLYVPIMKSNIFKSQENSNQIIGFLIDQSAHIYQEGHWQKISSFEMPVQAPVRCILQGNNFKIIKTIQVRKKEDKRFQSQGIVCKTLQQKHIDSLISQLEINEMPNKKYGKCQLLQDFLLQNEINDRINFIYKKTALILPFKDSY